MSDAVLKQAGIQTAKEICAEPVTDPEYTLYRLASAGTVMELLGLMKHGKTSLVMAGLKAVTTGQPFLGKPTRKTRVLYMTEQAPRTFRQQLQDNGLTECADLFVMYWHRVNDLSWENAVRVSRAICKLLNVGLLVVDTFTIWAKIADENDSGPVLAAIKPLTEAAATDNLAVLIVSHERKSGGQVVSAGRGSNARAGAVDGLVRIQLTSRDPRTPRRKLEGINRLEGSWELMIERMADGSYAVDTEEAEAAATPEPQEASAAHRVKLALDNGVPPEIPKLMAATGLSRASVYRELRSLKSQPE